MDKIKKGIRSWLEIQPSDPYNIRIINNIDFETNAIRNSIWYRGDSNELQQLYNQVLEEADRYKFWACRSSPGQEIRKIHTGLPGLMVKVLTDIVLNDLNEFEFISPKDGSLWAEMDKEDYFKEQLNTALRELLYVGDGAWKIAIDTAFSPYPMSEWVGGQNVEYVYQYGRIKELIFKTLYIQSSITYTLHEIYGYGYIKHKLYRRDEEVSLNSLPETADKKDLSCAFSCTG